MKKFILGIFMVNVILILLFVNNIKNTLQVYDNCDHMNGYSRVDASIKFMPGKGKCLQQKYKVFTGKDRYEYYYRNLKEFIITENNKYCFWGTKFWNEECQNTSMKYAYRHYFKDDLDHVENYKEFKQVVINFIKYIQANDIERALELTDEKAMFFTDDFDNCLIQEQAGSLNGCRSYFKQNSEHRGTFGEINLELFIENIMQIDADHLKFYLDDITKSCMYSVIIPYKYKGVQKYFDIRFLFSFYDYDSKLASGYQCDSISYFYPKIYDLGINSSY